MMKEEEENEKFRSLSEKKNVSLFFHRQIQKKFFITQTLYIVIRLHIYYLFLLNNDDDEKNDEKSSSSNEKILKSSYCRTLVTKTITPTSEKM